MIKIQSFELITVYMKASMGFRVTPDTYLKGLLETDIDLLLQVIQVG